MATITPVFGHQFVVKLGDGGSPEVFASTAMINTTRGVTFTSNTESSELIDVADQSKPATTVRRVTSTDTKIDGAGMVHLADLAEWLTWSQSGEVKNVRFAIATIEYEGAFVLTNLTVTAERMQTAEFSCTLEQADTVAPVA